MEEVERCLSLVVHIARTGGRRFVREIQKVRSNVADV
jgi:hypothetical protein